MRNARRIDANISIGSVPDAEDMVQLKELGYKTLVDLRDEDEKFGGMVEKRAIDQDFRYISIEINRYDIHIDNVLKFYRIVYTKSDGPFYVFSRFGKKPVAFIVLMEAVANNEPLVRVFQRASRMGFDLRGDLCLQSFLVNMFNSDDRDKIREIIPDLRPELLKKPGKKLHPPEVKQPQWPARYVQREDRENLLGQHGCTIWLTGLPSSGKSTTAFVLENQLIRMGYHAYVLDSDNIRHGLNNDLGFSIKDRTENIRRIGQVAKLFTDAGFIVITSFISPFRKDRQHIRNLHRDAGLGFVEVYLDAPMNICEQRDSRGFYKRAREGEILGFTGIDSPYEKPDEPAIVAKPETDSPEHIAEQIIKYLVMNKFVK